MSAFTFKDQAFLAGVVGGVTPPSFPNLLRWYKADSYSGVDGDSVGGGTNVLGPWTDHTANADHATGSSNGPIFKTNIVGTKPVIRFAIVTGAFLNFAPGSLGDFTVIAAAARTGTPSYIVSEPNVANHQIRRANAGSNEIVFYAGGAVITDTGLSGAATDFMVVTVRRVAGVVSLRQNKTAVGGGVEAAAWLVDQIGNSITGSVMDLGELMFWSSALSDADVDQLYDEYLKPRWTTLP